MIAPNVLKIGAGKILPPKLHRKTKLKNFLVCDSKYTTSAEAYLLLWAGLLSFQAAYLSVFQLFLSLRYGLLGYVSAMFYLFFSIYIIKIKCLNL
jgi:hypothetical protein